MSIYKQHLWLEFIARKLELSWVILLFSEVLLKLNCDWYNVYNAIYILFTVCISLHLSSQSRERDSALNLICTKRKSSSVLDHTVFHYSLQNSLLCFPSCYQLDDVLFVLYFFTANLGFRLFPMLVLSFSSLLFLLFYCMLFLQSLGSNHGYLLPHLLNICRGTLIVTVFEGQGFPDFILIKNADLGVVYKR